jgi:hypothetical protein
MVNGAKSFTGQVGSETESDTFEPVAIDGRSEGRSDGASDGWIDGTSDGWRDGASDDTLGCRSAIISRIGFKLINFFLVGSEDGWSDGKSDGWRDGASDDTLDCLSARISLTTAPAVCDGTFEGSSDDASDGWIDVTSDGWRDGASDDTLGCRSAIIPRIGFKLINFFLVG